MGYSWDSFYRFKDDKGGDLALAEMSRRKPILANRVAPEIEKAVVELAVDQPTWGQVRVSNELRKKGSLSLLSANGANPATISTGTTYADLGSDLRNHRTQLKV